MDIADLHRVVVQGFASMNDRFDSVDARLGSVEGRIVVVEEKLDSVAGRLVAFEARVEGEFGRVKDALLEHDGS